MIHVPDKEELVTRAVGFSGTYLHIRFWSEKSRRAKASDGIPDSTCHSCHHTCCARIHSGISSQKGGNMLSAAFGTTNERVVLQGRVRRRENSQTMDKTQQSYQAGKEKVLVLEAGI